MTRRGVAELYKWLMAAWPLVIKPGASPEFQSAKLEELLSTYADYKDGDVLAAFQKWTAENEKFPTTKNIINEIEWARIRAQGKRTGQVYMMDRIDNDGNEFVVSYGGRITFSWNEFIQLPANKDHLDPDEWERRYRIRRKQVLDSLRRKA